MRLTNRNDSMEQNGLCILPIGIEEETQIDRWEEIDQWSKSTPKAIKQKQSVVPNRKLLSQDDFSKRPPN